MNEFFFGTLNIFFFLASFYLLIKYYRQKRYLLLKATYWFSLFFCVRIQLYCCLFFDENFNAIRDNIPFLILTQVVPFISIVFTGVLFNKQAKKIWERVTIETQTINTQVLNRIITILFVFSCLILGVYLSFVPFTQTGFYTIFFSKNVLMATLAREHSLKLLPYTWLKYLYQFFAQFLALFICACITVAFNRKSKGVNFTVIKNFFLRFKYMIMVVVLMIGCILPGARAGAVVLLICMSITYFFIVNKGFNFLRYGGILMLIILPAILTQYFKYDMSIGEAFSVTGEIFQRILSVPVLVGIKWLNYVDYYDFFGVRGLSLFSFLDDRPYIHAPNLLMNHYFPLLSTKSGYLTTSFIFAYYCYLGPFVVPFLIVMLQFLDVWLYFYQYIRKELLLPAIVALNMGAISLCESEYFQTFTTYGYLTGLIFIFLVDKVFLKIKFKTKSNVANNSEP